MQFSSGRSRGSSDDRQRAFRRALAAGFVVSVAVHGALFVLPPIQTDVEARLPDAQKLVVLEPVTDRPPEVRVPPLPEPISQPFEPIVAAETPEPAEYEPVFIPHDVPPRLVNHDEVRRYLELFYPVALRAAEVEGAVHLWLYVNEQGDPTKLQLRTSSGAPKFDELAQSAAPFMQFRPAMNRGESIGVWVSLWVRFDIEDLPSTASRLAEGPVD